MQACGLIVEYNPLHNGHIHHIKESKKTSGADCLIAVMSGPFLQRGEPAVIDKFHRTKAALSAGVDIVLELPYLYAVQSSDLFAKGSVHTLYEMGASYICFGSESGDISHFTDSYDMFKKQESFYNKTLKDRLHQGLAFPEASRMAYREIGLTSPEMDLSKPNNILGFSYVKALLDNGLPIQPLTIPRTKSDYHDNTITGSIASATSIREQLFAENGIANAAAGALPDVSINYLQTYKEETGLWHSWEHYFNLIHYRVMTMSENELAQIHGVDEGIEYRIKKTAYHVTTFNEWINRIKTKRYTWTRLQRIFAHILTNTTKADMDQVKDDSSVPYTRLLGMTKTGQIYLNSKKKTMDVPIITNFGREVHPMLSIEEKATNAYYSILSPKKRKQFHDQELKTPIISH